jgi:hypothetical protein
MEDKALPNELPTQEVSDIPPVVQQTTSPKFTMQKGLLIGMVLVLIVSLSTAGFFAYQNLQLRQQIQQTQVTPIPSPTPLPSPEIAPKWETYLPEKIVDYFKTFKLYYPSSWKIIIEKGSDPARQSITLEKSGFTIRILQAPGSQASCLFPEDPTVEGMFARHGEYKEFEKNDGIIWRRSMPESQPPNELVYMVCEKKPDSEYFTGTASIGFISLRGPSVDNQILSEFDEILERIEILD